MDAQLSDFHLLSHLDICYSSQRRLSAAVAGPAASLKDVDGFSLGFISAFDFLHLARQKSCASYNNRPTKPLLSLLRLNVFRRVSSH